MSAAGGGGTGVSLVFVTVPSAEVGRKIAHSLVESRLAACVNIVPGVESVYAWQGKIESDQELLLKVGAEGLGLGLLGGCFCQSCVAYQPIRACGCSP